METLYWQVDSHQPSGEAIELAARLIAQGELVAFPTETVYGLGANAFSPAAVEKIYVAKGRPPLNPLLVHIAGLEQVGQLAASIPAPAQLLMERYWPGPLSLILPARPDVPEIVTAHHPGVGLRMPSHPVALALIREAGPIAAPSANLSGRPSPVTAQHVKDDLDGRIAAVLDAGPTGLGIESTVLDLTGPTPALIRVGGISQAELEKVLNQEVSRVESAASRLPHYQTNTKVLIAESEGIMKEMIELHLKQGKHVAVVHNQPVSPHKIDGVGIFHLNLNQSGSEIYNILREAERQHIEVLIFAPLPARVEGLAAAAVDRIYRASQKGS